MDTEENDDDRDAEFPGENEERFVRAERQKNRWMRGEDPRYGGLGGEA